MSESSSTAPTFPELLRMALRSLGDGLDLLFAEMAALIRGHYRRSSRRLLWLLAAFPLLLLWQGANWICLFLDELFFRQAAEVEIRSPLFVLGPPRSGTTHLHRLLAESSEAYATASALELLLAPSVLQKKILKLLARADRKTGRPLERLLDFVEDKAGGSFEEVHPGSLKDPEEDYFYLNPFLRCSGWMLAFPAWRGFLSQMPGCGEMSDVKRRQSLRFYRYCLQKQLYARGGGKILLSKNASFSSWLDLLPEFFPDARYVVCMRGPLETVPSMLSTADQAQKAFFAETAGKETHQHLLAAMRAHYRVLKNTCPELPASRLAVVAHPELKSDLEAVFAMLRNRLDLPMSETFLSRLGALAEKSRTHQSRHRYRLGDFQLDAEQLTAACPLTPSTLQTEAM